MLRMFSVELKAILVGDANCGKTSLVIAYTQNKCYEKHIQRFVDVHVVVDQYSVDLSLCSCSGGTDYYSRTALYTSASVILLCFSIDSFSSFTNVEEKWLPEVRSICPEAKVMLVGNKGDMRKFKDEIEGHSRKFVKVEDCLDMVDRIGAYAYIECSALTLQGIELVFETAIQASLSPIWFSEIIGSDITTTSNHTEYTDYVPVRPEDTYNNYKLVAVGDAKCGKASLLSAASKVGSNSSVYTEPIVTVHVNDYKVDFSLWKTNGTENDGSYSRKAYYNADVILLCYSLVSKDSLKNIKKKWIKELEQHCPNKIPIVLVGNKKDLVSSSSSRYTLPRKKKTTVCNKEGLKVARSINAYYVECSALNYDDVLQVFQSAAQAVLQKYLKVCFTF